MTYVTTADYQLVTGNAIEEDSEMASLLSTAERLFDASRGVASGHFGPIVGSKTYRFSPIGGSLLHLRDSAGIQYFLRGVTADKIEIDTNGDGVYEYAFDFADLWTVGYPENAVALGSAYTGIELLTATGATLTTVARSRSTVQITSTLWGHANVPGGVKQRVIDIAHAMKQRGFVGSMSDFDTGAETWVMKLIDRAFDHRLVGVA